MMPPTGTSARKGREDVRDSIFDAGVINELRAIERRHRDAGGARVKLGELKKVYARAHRGTDPHARSLAKVDAHLRELRKAEFESDKHPRKPDGEFAKKPGSASRKERANRAGQEWIKRAAGGAKRGAHYTSWAAGFSDLPPPSVKAPRSPFRTPKTPVLHRALQHHDAGYAALTSGVIPEKRYELAGATARVAGSAAIGLGLAHALSRGNRDGRVARTLRAAGGKGAAAVAALGAGVPLRAGAAAVHAARTLAGDKDSARGARLHAGAVRQTKAAVRAARAGGEHAGDSAFRLASAGTKQFLRWFEPAPLDEAKLAGMDEVSRKAERIAHALRRGKGRALGLGLMALPVAYEVNNMIQGSPVDPEKIGKPFDVYSYRVVRKIAADPDLRKIAADIVAGARGDLGKIDVGAELNKAGLGGRVVSRALREIGGGQRLYGVAGRAAASAMTSGAGAALGATAGAIHGAVSGRHVGDPYHDAHGRFTSKDKAAINTRTQRIRRDAKRGAAIGAVLGSPIGERLLAHANRGRLTRALRTLDAHAQARGDGLDLDGFEPHEFKRTLKEIDDLRGRYSTAYRAFDDADQAREAARARGDDLAPFDLGRNTTGDALDRAHANLRLATERASEELHPSLWHHVRKYDKTIEEAVSKDPHLKRLLEEHEHFGGSSPLFYKQAIRDAVHGKLAEKLADKDHLKLPIARGGEKDDVKSLGEMFGITPKRALMTERAKLIKQTLDRVGHFDKDGGASAGLKHILDSLKPQERETALHYLKLRDHAVSKVDHDFEGFAKQVSAAEDKIKAATAAHGVAQNEVVTAREALNRAGGDADTEAAQKALKGAEDKAKLAAKDETQARQDLATLKARGAKIHNPVVGDGTTEEIPPRDEMQANAAIGEARRKAENGAHARFTKRLQADADAVRHREEIAHHLRLATMLSAGMKASDVASIETQRALHGLNKPQAAYRKILSDIATHEATHKQEAAAAGAASRRTARQGASDADRAALRAKAGDHRAKAETAKAAADALREKLPATEKRFHDALDRLHSARARANSGSGAYRHSVFGRVGHDVAAAARALGTPVNRFLLRPIAALAQDAANTTPDWVKTKGAVVGRHAKKLGIAAVSRPVRDGSGAVVGHELDPMKIAGWISTGVGAATAEEARKWLRYARARANGPKDENGQKIKAPHALKLEHKVDPFADTGYWGVSINDPKDKAERRMLYGERREQGGRYKQIQPLARLSDVQRAMNDGQRGGGGGNVGVQTAPGAPDQLVQKVNDALGRLNKSNGKSFQTIDADGEQVAARRGSENAEQNVADEFRKWIANKHLNGKKPRGKALYDALGAVFSKQGKVLTSGQMAQLITGYHKGAKTDAGGILPFGVDIGSNEKDEVAAELADGIGAVLKNDPPQDDNQRALLRRAVGVIGALRQIPPDDLAPIYAHIGGKSRQTQPAAASTTAHAGDDRPVWGENEIDGLAERDAHTIGHQFGVTLKDSDDAPSADKQALSAAMRTFAEDAYAKAKRSYGVTLTPEQAMKIARRTVLRAAGGGKDPDKEADVMTMLRNTEYAWFDKDLDQQVDNHVRNMTKATSLDDFDALMKLAGVDGDRSTAGIRAPRFHAPHLPKLKLNSARLRDYGRSAERTAIGAASGGVTQFTGPFRTAARRNLSSEIDRHAHLDPGGGIPPYRPHAEMPAVAAEYAGGTLLAMGARHALRVGARTNPFKELNDTRKAAMGRVKTAVRGAASELSDDAEHLGGRLYGAAREAATAIPHAGDIRRVASRMGRLTLAGAAGSLGGSLLYNAASGLLGGQQFTRKTSLGDQATMGTGNFIGTMAGEAIGGALMPAGGEFIGGAAGAALGDALGHYAYKAFHGYPQHTVDRLMRTHLAKPAVAAHQVGASTAGEAIGGTLGNALAGQKGEQIGSLIGTLAGHVGASAASPSLPRRPSGGGTAGATA